MAEIDPERKQFLLFLVLTFASDENSGSKF